MLRLKVPRLVRAALEQHRLAPQSVGHFSTLSDLTASMASVSKSGSQAGSPEAAAEYDLVVVGGGSGGLAAAKEAARLGASVALVDYVAPSPAGSKWGLGGTCVNVGCIPKKLMHHAAGLGEAAQDAVAFGWNTGAQGADPSGNGPIAGGLHHDWGRLTAAVADVRRSSNWMYKTALWDESVAYENAFAALSDDGRHVDLWKKPPAPQALAVEGGGGALRGEAEPSKRLAARKVLLAPGTRPRSLRDAGGAVLDSMCITSDDVWTLQQRPKHAVIVGAGYIALETAGFLRGLGSDVTLVMRSKPLRGFDEPFAARVLQDLERRGVRVLRGVVKGVTGASNGSAAAAGEQGSAQVSITLNGSTAVEEVPCDTVINATGRTATSTPWMNLPAAGVSTVAATDGFLRADPDTCAVQPDMETAPWNNDAVFAVGDAVLGAPQLTPWAIHEGLRLAQRLFAGCTTGSNASSVPTVVFTPLEYSCVGLTWEEAEQTYGAGLVEGYHTNMTPTEWNPPELWKPKNACSAKVFVALPDTPEVRVAVAAGGSAAAVVPPSQQRVVGLHFLGPHAGEVMQGFAAAMGTGALTLETLRRTVGIHPTLAEEFTSAAVTVSSGASADKALCCG